MAERTGRSFWFMKRMHFYRWDDFGGDDHYRTARDRGSSTRLIHELDFSTLLFNEPLDGGWGYDDGDDGEACEWMWLEGIGPVAIIGMPYTSECREFQAQGADNPHPITGHRYDKYLWCMGCHLSYYADNLRDAPPCSNPVLRSHDRLMEEMERLRETMYGPQARRVA